MRAFSAVLPPRWTRFDLDRPVRDALGKVVESMLADVPPAARDRVRRYVFDGLLSSLNQLASSGVVTAFLPADNPAVAAAFPVFAVRPVDFTVDGEPIDPMDYLVGILGAGAATVIEPIGMVGVRRVTDRDTSKALTDAVAALPADMSEHLDAEAAARAGQAGRLSREIEYVIGVPETDDRWMAITASISVVRGEGSDELLEAVTSFADRWVETVQWVEDEDDHA